MILTFFLLSMLVLLADGWTDGWSTMNLFCVYRSSWRDPLGYIRLFGHVLGHANWEHFLNNMLLLLVVGPPMEEKYGSIPLLKGILFTALVTGVLQCILFPHTGLLGASGIVFMLIMLSSLAGFSGGIPVTMLLVAALYFGQQVYDIIFVHDNVANFMHIVGGLCGTAFCQIGSCLCQLLGTTIDLLCADLNGGQCLLHIGNDLHHGILDLYKVTDIFFRRLYTVIALTHLT